MVSFLFGFGFLLAWILSGCPDPSSTKLDTGTGEMSLLVASSRSQVLVSLPVSEEDEDEEDEDERLSCFIGVLKKMMKIQWTNLTSLEPR